MSAKFFSCKAFTAILAVAVYLVPVSLYSQTNRVEISDTSKKSVNFARLDTASADIPIGYFSKPVSEITGSVLNIRPELLYRMPYGLIPNMLQGIAPGVSVIGDGQPGDVSRVRIRGFSSFQNNDPLYVVDGVPTQAISSLNPNDVESISFLKDAGAASVYGSRASNGVIILTTKKGSTGTKINYSMYTGIQFPGKGPDNLLNTQEYANLQWLVYKNDGTVETHPFYGLSTNTTPTLPPWAANTNWYQAITRKAGIQNHDLSFSGGNENARFYSGIGVFRQDGILLYTHSDRYSLQFNSEFSFLNKKLKIGENISMAYRTKLSVPNLSEDSPIFKGPYEAQPIIPVVITTPVSGWSHNFVAGEWGGTGLAPRLGEADNEVAMLTRAKDNKNWNSHIIGSLYADWTIIKGLNLKSKLGGTFDNGYFYNYSFKTYEKPLNSATNYFTENAYYNNDWIWTNTLTFTKAIGSHMVTALAGYEAVKYGIGRALTGQRSGYFTDDVNYRTLNNGANTVSAGSTTSTPVKLASAFLLASYGFQDKYLLSMSLRQDRSSNFGPGNRSSIFPALSAAWRLGNESFFEGLQWINDLRIRGSWGKTGNQYALSPQNIFYQFASDPTVSYYDINGTFNSSVMGFYTHRVANPDSKCETTTATNFGIETTLLKNRVGLVFDWYSRKSDDLLFAPAIPGTAGELEELPLMNIASMKNSGIEMQLTYATQQGSLRFTGSAYVTANKNKILKIAENVDFFVNGYSRIGSLARNEVGHSLSEFYGYKVIGLFKTDGEVANAPYQDGAAPGFFKYQDTNNDGHISYDDEVFIGNPNPKFTSGVNLGLSYKNFDLSAFFFGSFGNDIFNWTAWWTDFWPSFQGQKSKKLLYSSWTPSRTNTNVPKATMTSNLSTNTQPTSYFIEKGSYLRCKSLQVGYSFSGNVISKVDIKSLRVYVQAVNLFTLTKYSGLDPEIGGPDSGFGIDMGNYPNVKQIIFGLNLTI